MTFRSRILASGILAFSLTLVSSYSDAQVVINELVQDQRNAGSGQIPDKREFIELYNAGSTSVDLSTWILRVVDLDSGGELYSIPLATNPILAAGDYYVIGNSAGIDPALIDFDFNSAFPEDFLTNNNNLYELRNGSGQLVDALGVQLTNDPQYDLVTTDQLAQIGGGYWPQLLSSDTTTPQSLGRYIDGRDTNRNGYDFGLIPVTPGASNTLPFVDKVVPDVQGMALGTQLPGYSSSFVQPTVVDPTVVGPLVKHAVLSPPPQGSKVIVAWDASGGGNMIASNALTNSFDINVYLDTEKFNVSNGTVLEWETTTYGIGSTDAFFSTAEPELALTTIAETGNGNTGIGWLYQKEEVNNFEKLMLIDFNDGGDSRPGVDWTVLETIDLSTSPSGWHRLAIDYDPETGEVIARFNDQVFEHTIDTGLVGTFYVGYREALSGGVPNSAGPPLFQLYVEEESNGDFDGDGDVDGRDFLVWQRNPSVGNLSDWKANYGTGGLAAITVPEPNAAMLAIACGLALLIPRKRG